MANLRGAHDYNIGIDLGTGSVGWAVTDADGNLYRFKGKPTWGSRLFESAEPASTARTYRGQRRRYDRRRQRLNTLQHMFQDEVEKVDPDFFIRLNQSRLWKEDRADGHRDYRWPLFDSAHPLVIGGKQVSEPEYYKMFPTIYHLRAWLMRTDEQVDIRLVYLVFHNIVKVRGNFLYQDLGPQGLSARNANTQGAVEAFVAAYEDWQEDLDADYPVANCGVDVEQLQTAVGDMSLNKRGKKDAITACFDTSDKAKKNMATAFASAFVGYKANLTNIFAVQTTDSGDYNFSMSNEEETSKFAEACPDEGLPLFESMMSVYSAIVLQGILHVSNAAEYWETGTAGTALEGQSFTGEPGITVSASKVIEYGRYGEDLASLKALVKEYFPRQSTDGNAGAASPEYNRFFRGASFMSDLETGRVVKGKGRSHVKYAPETAEGYTRYDLGVSKSSYDDFKKDVQKLFGVEFRNGRVVAKENTEVARRASSDERIVAMLAAFEEGTFLRRLKTSDNGVIPYQLHLEEMHAIIEKQRVFYPFLAEEHHAADGTVRNKIESLVSFRIPYYVGPLTRKNAAKDAQGNNRFAWSKRLPGKEDSPVHAWDWDEVIDREASADAFMHRMIGSCSYLWNEPVLPKCSLLYEKFCVLNELNGAYFERDGERHPFDREMREGIYNELFKTRGSVSYRAVEEWLARNNMHVVSVGGGQGEKGFESKLSSWRYFCKLLHVDTLSSAQQDMAENIVEWNTLFEDRSILRAKVEAVYGGNPLTEAQIKSICAKRFTGWGRLSKKLLVGLKVECDEGRVSIMDVLEDGYPNHGEAGKTNRFGQAMVFMSVLRDETLGFQEAVDQFNARQTGNALLEIEDLPYASPALRRGINQTLRIVEEIASIAGNPPANIYLESTRDEDNVRNKGKRTTKRVDRIKEQLKSLHDETRGILEELEAYGAKLDDDRLMLYFLQNGKCMYSGRPLYIERLSEYQIDHIIPQSYVKDDSLENRVLVYAEENQRKKDSLLLDAGIQRKMGATWHALHEAGLIGDKKYRALTCERISDKMMKGFINRQLVETSQVVKFAGQMLAQRYPAGEDGSGTHVRTIKAGVSHQLRQTWSAEEGRYVWRFPKVREMNDYHHAHDAYLAAEVGRFVAKRFPDIYDHPVLIAKKMRTYIKAQADRFEKTGKMPAHSFIASSFLKSGFDKQTGEIFRDDWDAEAELARISRYFDLPDCYVTHMTEIDSAAFSDATVYSPRDKKKGRNLTLPLKGGLATNRYGGFSREQFAYFFIFEKRDEKGSLTFAFAPVPVRIAARVNSGGLGALEEYATSLLKPREQFVRIVRESLGKNQVLEIKGSRVLLRGLGEVRNGTELAFGRHDALVLADMVAGLPTTVEERIRVYDECSEKLSLYAGLLSEKLDLGNLRSRFLDVSPQEQTRILLSVAQIASARTNAIDLTAIGGIAHAGVLKVTFDKLFNNSAVVIIDQSVTGMFEKHTVLTHEGD